MYTSLPKIISSKKNPKEHISRRFKVKLFPKMESNNIVDRCQVMGDYKLLLFEFQGQ